MFRSVTKAPHFTDLTLLATIKTEIAITTSADDAFINGLIKEASDAIVKYCDLTKIGFARSVWTESINAFDTNTLRLALWPVVNLASLAYSGSVQDPSSYYVSDPSIGEIYNDNGFFTSEVFGFPFSFSLSPEKVNQPPIPSLYQAVYTGGYLMPGDDVSGVSITASSVDNSFTLNVGRLPILVGPQNFNPASTNVLTLDADTITTSGFTNAANNGTFSVASVSGNKVLVSGATLVNETATAAGMAVRNLPYDLERACIETVKGWYMGRDRDWQVSQERIGGTRAGAYQATYGADRALPPQAQNLLKNKYIRAG